MTARNWLIIVGVFLIAVGLACFPGFGLGPEAQTSAFHRIANRGAFWKSGIVFTGLGLLVLIASVLAKERK